MVPAKQSFSIFYQISCEFGARLIDFGFWCGAGCVGLGDAAGCHLKEKACQQWGCECDAFSYSLFEASIWDDLFGALTP